MDQASTPVAESTAVDGAKKKPRLFYGWYIVAGTFFAHWMGAGIGVPMFGQFFKPMSSELGWSRSMTTMPLVARNIISHLIGPIIGPLMDRFGPRYLMTFGAIIAGIGTMLMSQVNSLWQFILYFAVIGAIGNAGLSNIVTNTTLAKWFVRKRGRATGIAASGINAGEMVMTPIVLVLLSAIGWRNTWMVMGLLPWLIVAPTSFIWMRRAPEDMGLRPDGDPPEGEATGKPQGAHGKSAADEHSWTPKAAFRTSTLWMIIIATNLASLAVSGVVLHQIPYLTDKGLSDTWAAMSLTTYAIFALPSKLVWGFLAERVHIRYLTAASMLGSAVGVVILIKASTPFEAILFGVVYGSTRGAWAVVSSLIWADYFGRHFLGAIRGFTMPFQLFSSVGGPLFAALVYDMTATDGEGGSYLFAFMVFVVTYVMGAVLILLTKQPTPPKADPAHAEDAPLPARA
ncbi:MAG: MFS transporter [Chloroflexi bacterium]|nr:MFS transporter [Chloroflexota bacterium]